MNGEGFTAIGNVAHIDGLRATFSSHLAAFEACMRIRTPLWRPHGRDTYFDDADTQAFALLNAQHTERVACP